MLAKVAAVELVDGRFDPALPVHIVVAEEQSIAVLLVTAVAVQHVIPANHL